MALELDRRQPWWSAPARWILGLTPRLLNPQELDLAGRLLYEVYFEEQGWDPPPNPSGLVADHARRALRDDFDDTALWYGLFQRQGRLVAIGRVLHRSRSGALELERYIDLPAELGPDLVEANRVAVRREHRRGASLGLLAALGEWTGRSLGAVGSVGAVTAKIADGPAGAYGWVKLGRTFRYHEQDPEPVQLVYYDLRRPALRRSAAALRILRRRLGKALRKRKQKATERETTAGAPPLPPGAPGDRKGRPSRG